MEARVALSSYKKIQKQIKRENKIQLNLTAWLPEVSKAAVFYIHGMQSHAGWMDETGGYLASRQIALYVLDRRGSGASDGLRGDVPSAEILLDDYLVGLEWVRKQTSTLLLTLMGQSLGGSILAALVCRSNFEIHYDNIIFCAPGLSQSKIKYSDIERLKLMDLNSQKQISVNLADEDYTNDSRYLQLMSQDKNMVRQITERAKAAFLQLEDFYKDKQAILPTQNSYLIYPMHDPIIHMQSVFETFSLLTGQQGKLISLPASKHYLEFSPARYQLWQKMHQIALSEEVLE